MHNNQSCIELWAIFIKDQTRWKWDLFIDTQYLIPLAIVHQEERTSSQPNESCTTDINGIWSFTKCLISVFAWFASFIRYLPSIPEWYVKSQYYIKSVLNQCWVGTKLGNLVYIDIGLGIKDPSSLVWSEAIPASEQGCTSLTTRSIIVKNQPWNPNSRTRQVWKFQRKSNRYLC